MLDIGLKYRYSRKFSTYAALCLSKSHFVNMGGFRLPLDVLGRPQIQNSTLWNPPNFDFSVCSSKAPGWKRIAKKPRSRRTGCVPSTHTYLSYLVSQSHTNKNVTHRDTHVSTCTLVIASFSHIRALFDAHRCASNIWVRTFICSISRLTPFNI